MENNYRYDADMSPEYKLAYDKNTLAIRAFMAVQAAYRARQIGDAEFVAARKVYNAAMAEFDEAALKEQNREQACVVLTLEAGDAIKKNSDDSFDLWLGGK